MSTTGPAATAGAEPEATPGPGEGSAALPALAAVGLRLRLQRSLERLCDFGAAGLSLAALALIAARLDATWPAEPVLLLGLALPAVGLLVGLLRPVPAQLAARSLDRAMATRDLATSACAFLDIEAGQRSRFMQATIDSARRHLARAEPAQVAPYRRPQRLLLCGGLATVCAALALFEPAPPESPKAPSPRAAPRRGALLHSDDLDAFRRDVDPIASQAQGDPETRALAQELNAIIEAMGEGRLDRAEAMRALRELQRKLEAERGEQEQAALREALAELGRSLDRPGETQEVADAFKSGQAARARESLETLAKELRDKKLSAAHAKQLQKLLERAAKTPEQGRQKELEQKRDELERLLKKKRKQAEASPQEKRLLKKRQRELERLQREAQEMARKNEARRKLDRLRRQLAEAARQLGQNNRQGGSEHLQQGAQQLQGPAGEQLSERQLQQLQQQLEQLRQLLSKQGGQGQQENDSQSKGSGAGKRPGGAGERLTLGRFAGLSRGKSGRPGSKGGEGGKPGESGEGEGEKGTLLMPGKGGKNGSESSLLLPGAQQSDRPGSMTALSPQSGAGEGGTSESGPKATQLDGKRVDTRVQGQQGKGPSRSEVIHESSRRGFASETYRKVHAEYGRHAQSVIERDEIPGGYRFYVRRYFQLIRPREAE